MIYTLTLNPSLDYIVSFPEFKCGQINRVLKENIYPGGKGINVSIVLKNLGIESTVVGFKAGFTGEQLQTMLVDSGVKTKLISVAEGLTRINVKIKADKESEINGVGPDVTSENISQLYEILDSIQDGDVLVMAGNIPDSIPDTIYMDVMDRLEKRYVQVIVDSTKTLLTNVLPYHPFLVKPNNHELEEIFNVTISSKEDVVFYAKKLQKMGARNVLVSMAGEGAVLLDENGIVYQAEAPKGIVKNSVGAGDSMVAGFLAGYLKYNSYAKAFQIGVCAGSASAFSEALATEAEIDALIERNVHLF